MELPDELLMELTEHLSLNDVIKLCRGLKIGIPNRLLSRYQDYFDRLPRPHCRQCDRDADFILGCDCQMAAVCIDCFKICDGCRSRSCEDCSQYCHLCPNKVYCRKCVCITSCANCRDDFYICRDHPADNRLCNNCHILDAC